MVGNDDWEYHLPVNPPGAHFREGFDVMMTESDIANWYDEGGYVFEPRIRDNVQEAKPRLRLAEDEAPEIDGEYDCD